MIKPPGKANSGQETNTNASRAERLDPPSTRTVGISPNLRAISSPETQVFTIGDNITINIFPSEHALNRSASQAVIGEFKKPGLVILPSDSTHGDDPDRKGLIYEMINRYFKQNPHQLNTKLRLTHMDELGLNDKNETVESFAENLMHYMPNIVGNGAEKNRLAYANKFNRMKVDHIPDRGWDSVQQDFDKFINDNGGARLVLAGVGAEADNKKKKGGPHIAYIGEGGKIQEKTSRAELRDSESERRNIGHAYTMGMNVFDSPNLELVIANAKGTRKAAAIVYALSEVLRADREPSGFGSLITRFKEGRYKKDGRNPQLIINLDRKAASQLEANGLLVELKKLAAHQKQQ